MREESPESQKQRLYRLVFESARDATVVFDAEGRVLLLNRAAREMPEELVERLVDGAAPRAAELSRFREELRLHGRAHAEVPVEGRLVSVDGKTHGDQHIVTLRDVTERRKMDLELRTLQRMESIGHLTASVVHDFNNLLTPIACLSAQLEKDLPADGAAGEMARDIRSAAERAAGLARQVLSFARREPSRTERLSPSAVVTELRSLIERVVGTGVEVDIVVDAAAGDVAVDRERLEQVLLNLAVNARDAMPGGGRLTIRTASVAFLDDVEGVPEGASAGSYVVLTVADTGVGMASSVRERVFERFFSTKEKGQGSGMGLPSARRFAAESRGCITVHSEPGRGATVALYLPRVDADERTPATSIVAPDSTVSGAETLLVVDDEELVRSAMRAVLVDRGYQVLVAASAKEALDIVETFDGDIHLAIIDVVMPGMPGSELARRVQALRPTRVLLTSGHTDRALELHGVQVDETLLRKAFSPAELLRKVRGTLDRNHESERSCG